MDGMGLMMDWLDACTCEKAADGGYKPGEHETDFTTQK